MQKKFQLILIIFVLCCEMFVNKDIKCIIFIITGIILYLTTNDNSSHIIKLCAPLICIIIIGFININYYNARDTIRDICFSIMPVVLIYIGYVLGRDKQFEMSLFNTIICLAFACSVINIFQVYFNKSDELSLNNYRLAVKFYGADVIVVGIFIIILSWEISKHYIFANSVYIRYALAIIMLYSIAIMFSRTLLISIIITFACLVIKNKVTSYYNIALIICIIVFSISTLFRDLSNTLEDKLLRSITETTKNEFFDFSEINNNWRAYEVNCAVQQFTAGNVGQIVFGQGFGSRVALGFTMELDGKNYNAIPVLHNGYAYLLFKTGLAGCICYLIFYIKMLKLSGMLSLMKISVNSYNRLLCASILCLITSMFVVNGMVQGANSLIIIFAGYSIRKVYWQHLYPCDITPKH